MPDNKELFKSITTSSFTNGGLLDAKRQARYFEIIRENSKFLGMIRTERQTQSSGKIDKLMLGEPITEGADENTGSSNYSGPKFGQIDYLCKKTRSQWYVTYESLQENIIGKTLEAKIANGMSIKSADDFELLAIQGDESISGSTTPQDKLLKVNNGFDKLTDSCHLIDAGGSTISNDIFLEAIRRMPQAYKKNLNNLKFFCSSNLKIDYIKTLQARNTNLGDAYLLNNQEIRIAGVPLIDIPYIPSDKNLIVSTATSAQVIGFRQDPFVITTNSNDKLSLEIDNSGTTVTVTLPQGTFMSNDIAGYINAAVAATTPNIAKTDGFGKIILTSPTAGATSEIDIKTIANSAYDTLGLTVAVTNGEAAAPGSNTVKDGTFIWLADPQNFIQVIQEGTRMLSEYNKDTDRLETVMYNQTDYVIENTDAIVKVINIKNDHL